MRRTDDAVAFSRLSFTLFPDVSQNVQTKGGRKDLQITDDILVRL